MSKFTFFGSSLFSVTVLHELEKKGFLPSLVVTTPSKPKGRGLVASPNEVTLWAEARTIPVYAPVKLDADAEKFLTKEICPIFIVASYGKIIGEAILSIPSNGTLNVHPSLLPKYRGAAPIPSQILADDKNVGVSIMVIDKEVDHGPLVISLPVTPQKWPMKASELKKILGEAGGKLLGEILPKWLLSPQETTPQDHSKATFTKKIEKEDGLLDISRDAYKNFLKFSAYDDSVGTYFFVEKKGTSRKGEAETSKKIRVRIKDAEYVNDTFTPLRVVPEGSREMSYQDFLRGLTN